MSPRYLQALARSCHKHNKPPGSACFPHLPMVCLERLGLTKEKES